MPADLVWTRVPPSELGWYLCRRSRVIHAGVVRVEKSDDGTMWATDIKRLNATAWGGKHNMAVYWGDTEWFGPIPPPKEADRG